MADLIKKIKDSGLTGRGGAGFPTGQKWEAVKNAPGAKKYIIANGSEGEPGVTKDGFILENYPEEVVGGIKLAMKAINADEAYIVLKYELFEKYAAKLTEMVGGAKIKIFQKVGGYLSGEESTMLEAIEGKKRIEPREKPPYPTENGLWGYPTLINNIETFYAVYLIEIDKYQQERFYTISGETGNPGVYILPENWPLEKILHKTRNFPQNNFFIQAGGGASGKILTEEELDQKAYGMGAIVIYDQKKTDPKKLMKKWLDFYFQENCGKCVPCREGVYRLRELLNKAEVDWELVKEICLALRETSFCPLGKSVAVPMESLITKVIKK